MSAARVATLLIALLVGAVSPLGAQSLDDNPPPGAPPARPDFIPPAPSSFTPPPPPPSGPPGAPPGAPPSQAGDGRTVVPPRTLPSRPPPAPPGAPTRVDLAALASTATTPGIFDPNSPEMQRPFDQAGMAVVELGTNDILGMLQTLIGKPILRQQNLPAVKITFDPPGGNVLTKGQAVRAIESLLALNGIALTQVGDDFIKAVPSSLINTQVPILWEGTTLGATPTQMVYEKVFNLDFLTPSEALPLIQPITSQTTGAPIAFEKSGILLVTDSLINLQRIERILQTIDAPSDLNTEVLFFQLQNVESQQVLRRLQQIQAGPLRRRLENNTAFDADERTNQLIIFTHRSNKALFEELIAKMDIDVAPITSTKVYSIRYAEATEVVNIIDQVVSGQKEVRDDRGNAQNAAAARRAAQQAAQQQAANAAAAAIRADSSNLQFSDFLTLVADERANSIVASGTTADLRALDALIDQIDVLLAQVRIEAVIVEVTLNEGDASGIDSLGFSYDQQAAEGSPQYLTNDSGQVITDDQGDPIQTGPFGNIVRTLTPGALGGLALGEDGLIWDSIGNLSLSVFANAVAKQSNAQILSAPTIVTTHNREANISVGTRRPIITGTSASATTEFRSSQVQYQNIGIELSVTPLIGSNNVIQLEIEQSVEDTGEEVEIDGNLQPSIISRKASSFVSVGDGQLVVLGGLQRVRSSDSESKFPILGHIPLLDKIFTRTTESETREEIILFLRPHIIRNTDEADALAHSQIGALQNSDRVESYLENGTFNEEPEEPEEERELPRAPKRNPVAPGR